MPPCPPSRNLKHCDNHGGAIVVVGRVEYHPFRGPVGVIICIGLVLLKLLLPWQTMHVCKILEARVVDDAPGVEQAEDIVAQGPEALQLQREQKSAPRWP